MFKKFFSVNRLVFLVCLFVIFSQQNPLMSGYPVIEHRETLIFEVPVPDVIVNFLPYEVFEIGRISAYNPVPRQTWGDPNVSSCGPNLERQIAVSRDLFFDEQGRKHLCGARVTVVTDRGEVFEDYIIWDTMNPRFRNTVDIMLPHTDESEAFAFGITTGVVYIYID
jgi:hypothetical protein